jgi:hypothetical protein
LELEPEAKLPDGTDLREALVDLADEGRVELAGPLT